MLTAINILFNDFNPVPSAAMFPAEREAQSKPQGGARPDPQPCSFGISS